MAVEGLTNHNHRARYTLYNISHGCEPTWRTKCASAWIPGRSKYKAAWNPDCVALGAEEKEALDSTPNPKHIRIIARFCASEVPDEHVRLGLALQ